MEWKNKKKKEKRKITSDRLFKRSNERYGEEKIKLHINEDLMQNRKS